MMKEGGTAFFNGGSSNFEDGGLTAPNATLGMNGAFDGD